MKPKYRRTRNRVSMNASSNSVIICEPSPTCSKVSKNVRGRTKMPILRPSRLSKIPMIVEPQLDYESPLKHIQDGKIKDRFACDGQTSMKEQTNDSQELTKKDSHIVDNSVIVLSDSENETTDKDILDCWDDFDVYSYMKYTESMKALSNSLRNGISTCFMQRRRSKRNALREANSWRNMSSMEESGSSSTVHIDEENIEPSTRSLDQMNDDITVIWSSEGKSSEKHKISEADQLEKNNMPKQKPLEQNEVTEAKRHIGYNLRRNSLKKKKPNEIIEDRSGDINNLGVLELNNQPKKVRRSLLKKPSMTLTIHKINVHKRKKLKKKNTHIALKQSRPIDKEVEQENSNTLEGSLREIIVDGCNVAMAYTNGKYFSEMGIKLILDYFTERGHTVKVFLPHHKRSFRKPLLEKWYSDGVLVFTPSRKIGKKVITSYDDRFILEYATMRSGIVISSDQYRDLYEEKPEWRDTIENRLLTPTFVGDCVMFPDDPLGRKGPTLNAFLRHKPMKDGDPETSKMEAS